MGNMNTNVPLARETDVFGDTAAEPCKGQSFFQFKLLLPDIENCRSAPGKSPKLKDNFITKVPFFPFSFLEYI